MTPEQWQQAREVLADALELKPEDRPAFLDRACSSDRHLRQEVERMLASSDEVRSNFLQSSTFHIGLTPGAKLGDYEVQTLIGSGGMGEVYRARDTRLGREVAIKVLPAVLSHDPDRLRRFEQEAQAAAALNHPNILAVHQMGTYKGAPYLVSELLEGDTLREQLRRGPLSVRKAIDYGVQVAGGLGAAHEKGIVHRDLKPENLFVTKDGWVKILDFGLAKLKQLHPGSEHSAPTRDTETEPGLVMGTVGYMAPEQVRAQTVDHRADIFSFGAVLYEMLTAKPAFQKPTSAETMSAILSEMPKPPTDVNPALPPHLDLVVEKALEKDRSLRYQSAAEIRADLNRLERNSTSRRTARGSTDARLKSGLSRGWRLVASLGIAGTAIAVLCGVALWQFAARGAAIEEVRQLTDNGVPKYGELATDGKRIYFSEGELWSLHLAEVSVTGGQTVRLPFNLDNPEIAGLASDGSELLTYGGYSTQHQLWSVPLPAGEPRQLAALEVDSADLLPDRSIIFSKGAGLYAADRAGLDVRPILARGPDIIRSVAVSPQGELVAFIASRSGNRPGLSVWESQANGKSTREVLMWPNADICCVTWTPDERYLVFRVFRDNGMVSDLWATRAQPRFWRYSSFRLTNGPLSYSGAAVSADGRQILAIGTKRRGELLRYDAASSRFIPFLGGISATRVSFSRDGKWIAYLSYPDHVLWRSRVDGSELRQLTYPPTVAVYPCISPDGTKVAYNTADDEVYIIDIGGGQPDKIAERSFGPTWSPDGSAIAVTTIARNKSGTETNDYEVQTINLKTRSGRILPASQGKIGAFWLSKAGLVAATVNATGFVLFDFASAKWSTLVAGAFVSWWVSTDGRYLYYSTAGAQDPKILRVYIPDRRVDLITTLKGIRRPRDPLEELDLSVAPDGSPIITRDIGHQEIYALTVKWP